MVGIIMSIKKKFKTIRDNYIIKQVENAVLPNFNYSNTVRKKLYFNGRVQKVGFRMEVSLLANKLGLTGWAKNTENGEVEVEIQGEENKIDFLIQFMKSLKRIKIVELREQIIEKINTEDKFIIIR